MARIKEKGTVSKQVNEASKEQLEVAAYYHWINRGCPTNDDLTDWVEAEKQWKSLAGEAGNN
jgi:hypothetical protein